MKQADEIEVSTLAVSLKISGRTIEPPASERTMRHCAKLGEFPVFQIGNSGRQYVLLEELTAWMKRRGTRQ
jgi:hypothetical protein